MARGSEDDGRQEVLGHNDCGLSRLTVKIVSWNIENASRHLGNETKAPLRSVHQQLGSPDLFCLQELRQRAVDEDGLAQLAQALPGFEEGHSLPRDPKNVTFRGGRMYGVATFASETLRPAFSVPEWDLEGRVIVCTLPASRLAVVNLYAVNGTDKWYFDHQLGRVDGDRHAFKRRFQRRVSELGRRLTDQGYQLVLIGDWNVSQTTLDVHPRLRTEEPHALARKELREGLIEALDLVDVYRHLHPTTTAYTWYLPAKRLDAARVDFALISRSLLPRVVEAEILGDPSLRHRSDHAPIVVDLDTDG